MKKIEVTALIVLVHCLFLSSLGFASDGFFSSLKGLKKSVGKKNSNRETPYSALLDPSRSSVNSHPSSNQVSTSQTSPQVPVTEPVKSAPVLVPAPYRFPAHIKEWNILDLPSGVKFIQKADIKFKRNELLVPIDSKIFLPTPTNGALSDDEVEMDKVDMWDNLDSSFRSCYLVLPRPLEAKEAYREIHLRRNARTGENRTYVADPAALTDNRHLEEEIAGTNFPIYAKGNKNLVFIRFSSIVPGQGLGNYLLGIACLEEKVKSIRDLINAIQGVFEIRLSDEYEKELAPHSPVSGTSTL